MPAYMIGRLQMRDPGWLKKYGATVPSSARRHGGRYLVRGGKMETIAGKEPLPNVTVLLEFPTMDDARRFHDDPDYAPSIAMRQASSDLEMVVEGL